MKTASSANRAVSSASGGNHAFNDGEWVAAIRGLGDSAAMAVETAGPLHDSLAGLPSDIVVNTATAGAQWLPNTVTLAGGRIVVVWRDASMGVGGAPGDSSGTAVKVQLFEANGTRVGDEILVNTAIAGSQGAPDLAALEGGGFVVTWSDASAGVGGATGDSSGTAIKAQVFDSSGGKTGSEILVNTVTSGDQVPGDVLGLGNGGFLVTWSGTGAGTVDMVGSAIKAQLFEADGDKVGAEFLVNDGTGDQFFDREVGPRAVTLSNGGFVVGWGVSNPSAQPPIPMEDIFIQVFDAAGAKVGTQINLAPQASHFVLPELVSFADGGFATVWLESSARYKVRLFDNAGAPIGTEILLDSGTTTDPFADSSNSVPSIVALAGGGFVVSWDFNLNGGNQPVSRAQVLDEAGNKIGGIIEVGNGSNPEVVALANGGFVVVISGTLAAREYDSLGQPVGDTFHVPASGANVSATVLNLVPADDGFFATWTPLNGEVMAQALAEGNPINGTPGDDTLTGTAGPDVINGLGGNDFINGIAGVDEVRGGPGDDTYVVDLAADQAIELAGEGYDIVYAINSYTLTPGSEIERLSAIDWSLTDPLTLIGNTSVNLIQGNAGNNLISGGGGADTLMGFGGDDVYLVDTMGTIVTEAAGHGYDVVYAINSYALTAGSHVEVLSAIDWSQTVALDLTGNTLANLVQGNAGNNLISGGGGTDTLSGFGGNDTYIVDSADDVVIESSGRGNDIVYAIASYGLGFGVSVETLSAIDWSQTVALNLTGNDLANTLYGNAGANVLNGDGGADTLYGFGGNDIYVVDNVGDAVFEASGNGTDTVYALTSFTLNAGSHVETLSTVDWSALDAMNLTGNELDNIVYGNVGSNTLNGGGGNDTLRGFGGADTFAFTTALGAGNVDTILDFLTGIDRVALDDAVFAGLAPGPLATGAFATGTAAQDAEDRIIYDPQTGVLLFDADGTGALAAVQFAVVTSGIGLTASDFVVI